MKVFLTLAGLALSTLLWGQSETVRVRLFADKTFSTSQIRIKGGHFYWVAYSAEGEIIDTVSDSHRSRGWLHDISIVRGQIHLGRNGLSLGLYPQLRLVPTTDTAWYLIKASGPERVYEGTLEFKATGNTLQLVSEVTLPEYLAGVVESEGGHSPQYEYYKAQAVLAHTWLRANWNKHISEGYNVKDDVSSQAYFSRAYLRHASLIREAVAEIGDTILVDQQGKPILGVFHSNSGGQTANSEEVWSAPVSYLRSVPDSFSLRGTKATWEKRVNKSDFLEYIAGKVGVSPLNAAFRVAVLEYAPRGREGYFSFNGRRMKWRDVRARFGLRSTWFTVREDGAEVVLRGRGFGHGVGLSQEGAMVMAELGFCYNEILSFYFRDTELVPSSSRNQ